MKTWRCLLYIFGSFGVGIAPLIANDYAIENIQIQAKAPSDESGVWQGKPKKEFVPSIKVTVHTTQNHASKGILAKVYFFDANNRLLGSVKTPAIAVHPEDKTSYALPPTFFREK